MTRLNTYLLNEGRGKQITVNKAKTLVKDMCSDILKNYKLHENFIYRGADSSEYYQFVDPTKGTARMSKNTRNYYTLLIDNLPIWKKYPKRSHSIVCSTDEYKAGGYGSLFIVFPYNNAKIGFCQESDIWFSFEKSFNNYNLNDFNIILQDLLVASTNEYGRNFDKSWKNLTDVFKESEARIQSFLYDPDESKIDKYRKESIYYKEGIKLFDLIQNGKSYIKVLSNWLNPTKNKFQLKTPKTFNTKGRKEVWVGSAPSILVKSSLSNFTNFFNSL